MNYILKLLFPNLSPTTFQNQLPCSLLVSISTENYLFLIEAGFDHSISPDTIKQLFYNIPVENLEYGFVNDFFKDNIIPESYTYSVLLENSPISFTLPIEFLTYIAKHFQLISKTYRCSTIIDLYKELFRFYQGLIPLSQWQIFSKEQMINIFNCIMSQKSATMMMLALFFEHINLIFYKELFSKRIAEQLKQEYQSLSALYKSLFISIHFIIQRNMFLICREKNFPELSPYKKMINYYYLSFIQESFKTFSLKHLYCIKYYQQNSTFSIFLKQLNYNGLAILLKHGQPENKQILKKGFSERGFQQLEELSHSKNLDLFTYQVLLKQLANHEYNTSDTSCEMILGYLTRERDWEILIREIDLKKVIIILDKYPKLINSCTEILKKLYQQYKNQEIAFPEIEKITFSAAVEDCCTGILYLKYLNLI
ncbi:MAG: hypothetical protein ACRCTQ_04480 [Brevinemataceae bacterium]